MSTKVNRSCFCGRNLLKWKNLLMLLKYSLLNHPKGYATEAVKAFLPVAYKLVGTDSVQGICLNENVASKHVLQKCGFEPVLEGVGDYQGEKREVFKSVWKLA